MHTTDDPEVILKLVREGARVRVIRYPTTRPTEKGVVLGLAIQYWAPEGGSEGQTEWTYAEFFPADERREAHLPPSALLSQLVNAYRAQVDLARVSGSV